MTSIKSNTAVSYMDSAIDRLKDFETKYGDEGKAELNGIAYAHVITIDIDEEKKFSYCGCDIFDGKIRILFKEGNMGVNISYALDQDVLMTALNSAPPAADAGATMSYTARTAIRQDYDPKIDENRKKIADMLEKPDFKLNPNFEANFNALKAAAGKKKSEVRDDWEKNIGYLSLSYFEGLVSQMDYQKFGDDEMMREGFNEAVESGEVVLRIVDKLSKGSYNEVLIENGILYIQVRP
jgi:hypothetical protein